MTDPNATLIAVLLDRSGSMSTIRDDMQGGFDSFIEKQRDSASPGAQIRVTLAQFDTQYETVYSNVPISEVPPLELSPRGGTALLDGIGHVTNQIGAELAALDEDRRPSRVLVVVITDGRENMSCEFTKEQIRKLVGEQESKWNWTYVFLGANMDAIAESGGLGIGTNSADGTSHSHSLTYSPTRGGTRAAFDALSGATMDYLAAEPEDAPVAFAFSSEQREKAQDK